MQSKMSEIKLDVLAVGSLVRDGKRILEAHSSSTLVRNGERNIVVDTSSEERKDSILYSLQQLGILPEEIDTVVITHLHDDHTGNIGLFPRARLMAHEHESPPFDWTILKGGEELIPGVKVMHTPGHSPGSISVFVEADRRYAIAGDALPTEDNYVKNVPPGIHYDRDVALQSIKRIVDYAQVVVPGHGFPFLV